jgi:phenylalanyl-tRNA synthetase beta chain
VDHAVPVQSLLESVAGSAGDAVVDLRIFDVYEGKGIPDGQKSVAIRLTLRDNTRTLTDEEVEALIARVLGDLHERHGARLRL